MAQEGNGREIEMVVRVHEPGQHDALLQVDARCPVEAAGPARLPDETPGEAQVEAPAVVVRTRVPQHQLGRSLHSRLPMTPQQRAQAGSDPPPACKVRRKPRRAGPFHSSARLTCVTFPRGTW